MSTKHLPRVYLNGDLSHPIHIPTAQAHHIQAVLRKNIGDTIIGFNATYGNILMSLSLDSKKNLIAQPLEKLNRQAPPTPFYRLAFGLIKKERLSYIVEKATELNVQTLLPLYTEYVQHTFCNTDKLTRIAIQATQQCGRLSPPHISTPLRFADFLDTLNTPTVAFLEKTNASHITTDTVDTILVGPEGGFSPKERLAINEHKHIKICNLGALTLRTETACISALSVLAHKR